MRGLVTLAQSVDDLQVTGKNWNMDEALQFCDHTNPDILIVDLDLTENECSQVLYRILEQQDQIHVLVLLPASVSFPKSILEAFGRRINCLPVNATEDEFFTALKGLIASIQDAGEGEYREAQVDQDSPFTDTPTAQLQAPPETAARSQPRDGEKLTQELEMAGRIQADIMPEVTPSIRGWDIAARLIPARETSGDFYDFIPLNERKMGIVIADVTDKGMGAALFMALSSTLLRTYAYRFPTLPGLTLKAVSDRILSDTRGSMFVTAIFGVLEPHTGRFIYANAGHPSGFRITTQKKRAAIQELKTTGMALGVSEQSQWRQKEIRLDPGDLLILYTDGVVEAQNPQGEFFEEDRLLDAALAAAEAPSAAQVLDHLLAALGKFVGKSTHQDDIALIVIRRGSETTSLSRSI